MEWERDHYVISTDPERLDLDVVHDFLRAAHPGPDVPPRVLERSIENSLVFGLFAPDGTQVGLARVLTDPDASLYLADVFLLEHHAERDQWLVETIHLHPDLEGMRGTLLGREKAHRLYVFEPSDARFTASLERRLEEL